MAWITMMLGRASGEAVGPFTQQSSNGVMGAGYNFIAKAPAAGGGILRQLIQAFMRINQ